MDTKNLTIEEMRQRIREDYAAFTENPHEAIYYLASKHELTPDFLLGRYAKLLKQKLKPNMELKVLNAVSELVINSHLPKQIELGKKSRETIESLSKPLQELVDQITAPKDPDVIDVTPEPLSLVK